MRIQATKIKAEDLKAGDLFSTAGSDYWDDAWELSTSVGEKVYIRTPRPCPPGQWNIVVYRIQVETEAIG